MLGFSSYLVSMSRNSVLMADHLGGEHTPYPRTMMLKVTSSGLSKLSAGRLSGQ